MEGKLASAHYLWVLALVSGDLLMVAVYRDVGVLPVIVAFSEGVLATLACCLSARSLCRCVGRICRRRRCGDWFGRRGTGLGLLDCRGLDCRGLLDLLGLLIHRHT